MDSTDALSRSRCHEHVTKMPLQQLDLQTVVSQIHGEKRLLKKTLFDKNVVLMGKDTDQ